MRHPASSTTAIGCAYTVSSSYPLAEPIRNPAGVDAALQVYARARHEAALHMLAALDGIPQLRRYLPSQARCLRARSSRPSYGDPVQSIRPSPATSYRNNWFKLDARSVAAIHTLRVSRNTGQAPSVSQAAAPPQSRPGLMSTRAKWGLGVCLAIGAASWLVTTSNLGQPLFPIFFAGVVLIAVGVWWLVLAIEVIAYRRRPASLIIITPVVIVALGTLGWCTALPMKARWLAPSAGL